ncbi:WD40 repeat-like protein [Gonapodya prolifera JEL478]|uniref:WD40 repeat-like protein n=1 Tax=Gonapodya prolifera (strain JEL478) TaxID=1344416 RepID=A0A139ALK4_GONPJ|nr:WD40 repeat-like protein [Gonapodya prolifera JEL478]|eukprot:KXS17667.1 WD40 repeat-like protein [Gonapodya prolifera JEL478]
MTISSLFFVPKGVAAPIPSRFKLTDEEYERINRTMEAVGTGDGDAEDGDLKEADDSEVKMETTETATAADPDLAEFNLDEYDADAPEDTGEDATGEDGAGSSRLFSNISSLKYYNDDSEDPFLVREKGTGGDAEEDDEPDEKDDMRILPSDNLLLAARTKDEISHVEVYVYESEHDNLYVHHDFLLPSFPLCLEWIDFDAAAVPQPGKRTDGASKVGGRNFVAVGTFDPTIEIWNLDVVDAAFPELILGDDRGGAGGEDVAATTDKKKKKKKKKSSAPQLNPYTHVAAVLALSSNRSHRNLLLSASADSTVKLWDLNNPSRAASNYTHHRDKVACVQWNWAEATVAATAGYDKKVHLFDTRSPGATSPITLPSDPESILFDSHTPTTLYASTDAGLLIAYDTRHTTKPLWTLHAHDGATSSVVMSPSVRGCLVTGGDDGTVKVWDVSTEGVKSVVSKEVGVGKVFSTTFIPDPTQDTPLTVAIGGSTGKLVVWNLSANESVQTAFGQRMNLVSGKASKPELTTLEEEEEVETDSEDEEDGDGDGETASDSEEDDEEDGDAMEED